MGLLLSRSHLHGEDNGLQQSAVCILWLTDVKFIKLTTSLRQRQNLRVSLDFNWFFLVLGKPLLAPYSFNIFVCYFPKERIAP